MARRRGSSGDSAAGLAGAPRAEQVLAEAEAALGVGSPECDLIGVFVFDARPQIVAVSTAIFYWLGWTGDALRPTPPRDFVHPDDLVAASESLAGALEYPGYPGYLAPVDLRVRAPGGRWVPVEVRAERSIDGGDPRLFVFSLRDASDRSRTDALVTDQNQVLEMVARSQPVERTLHRIARLVEDHAERAGACCIMIAADGVLAPGAAPSLGSELTAALGSVIIGPAAAACGTAAHRGQAVVCPDIAVDPLWLGRREPALGAGYLACWSTPALDYRRGSTVGTVDFYATEAGLPTPQQARLLELAASLVVAVLERRRADAMLVYQATHDPLTELPNRTLLDDRLGQALLAGRGAPATVAVIFFDLDNFKSVNDAFGHAEGDGLLVEVARRFESTLRPGDTVARFGGDEFVVLCHNINRPSQAAQVARRAQAALADPIAIAKTPVVVTASAGIRVADKPGLTVDDMLRDADTAMYRAKAQGRGGVEIFDETHHAAALARHALETDLRLAVDAHDITVHFQPIVSLRDRSIVGLEALARWEHPDHGLLYPGSFIGVAEDLGVIGRLGASILGQVCRWRSEADAPPEVVTWVNVSAAQLADWSFIETLTATLRTHGIPPRSMGVEITESILMDDRPGWADMLRRLADTGVRIGIDDFGTGYSSLAYLRRFPIHVLKIDRSFVQDLPNPTGRAIISAVTAMADAMTLECSAEGVERDDQIAELVSLGCGQAQGYLLGEPAAPAALPKL